MYLSQMIGRQLTCPIVEVRVVQQAVLRLQGRVCLPLHWTCLFCELNHVRICITVGWMSWRLCVHSLNIGRPALPVD